MTRLRVVVVGAGRIGSTFADEAASPGVHSHAQAWREDDRTELVGIADADPQRAQAAARRWSTAGSTDAAALCRETRPDIVSVCTPDATHVPIAHAILDAHVPRLLFMEKPLATSLAEGEKLVERARELGVSIAMHHPRRHSPAFRAVRDDLARGALGRPIFARILYGKGLLHNGTHAVDLLRWWLGEPTSIQATGAPTWGPPGDPTYAVDLEFPGGARARLEPFDERVATIFEGELFTDAARVRFSLGGAVWERFDVQEGATYAGYRNYVPTSRPDARFDAPMRDLLARAADDIIAHVQQGTPLACDGEDALRTLRCIEDARRSVRR